MQVEKRWNILPCDEDKAIALQQALGINLNLCRILTQRGIEDFNTAKDFFNPSLSMLHSPWLMKDMQLAVERIAHAISSRENIPCGFLCPPPLPRRIWGE
jgi:single-stranded-DNA-specific exonuclease